MYTMWYVMIFKIVCCCCSVAMSCVTLCDLMDYIAHQVLWPLLSPRVCSNSCPLSQWWYLTISSSVTPFFCLQSFPALGSFPINWLFTSGGQNIRASASASVLLMNIQGWFNLRLTGLISVLTKGLSKAFSSTTI